jgi:hypothetical protein
MNILEFCKIKYFCIKYHIKNYTINPDGSIDVNGSVNLNDRLGDMKKLPVKFGKVSGYFWCNGNNLTTLEGCPNYVGGYFYCLSNNLTSLERCPKYIGRDFGGDNLTHHILGNVRGNILGNAHNIILHNKQRIVI